jgi:hypothetical protein
MSRATFGEALDLHVGGRVDLQNFAIAMLL